MPAPLYTGFSSVNRPGINSTVTNIELIKKDLELAILVPIRSVRGYARYGSIIPLTTFELDSPTGGLVNQLVENARQQIRNDPRVKINSINLERDTAKHTITLNISLLFVEFNMSDNLTLTFSTETR
jgi:hypothetical protein